MRRSDAVTARIATSDHHDFLPSCKDGFVIGNRVARNAAVLLFEEIHGEMDAFELTARHIEVSRHPRTHTQAHRIEVCQ